MNSHDLLFELGTEELPPRTLLNLSTALTDGIVKAIDAAGIAHGKVRSFATPRRLAVYVAACAESAPDRKAERRGPPVSNSFDVNGAPTQAATAFAKSCGVDVGSLERLLTDKGAWLVYRGTEKGAATTALIGPIITQAIAALPIARRMRWGTSAAEFVRPVHSVVLLYGEDVVPLEVLGLKAGRTTFGHRFHAPRPIVLKSPKSYESRLRAAKVVADFGKRRTLIREGVMAAAAGSGAAGPAHAPPAALLSEALLDEVTALVEWPVAIAGHFEARFLALPREVIIATIQEHQRYFAVEDAAGKLTGAFVTVSNIQSRDPAKVREGNERVVRPRLSDAAFFYEQDRKLSLTEHAAKLGGVIFQTKLGSYADKTRRVKMLAELLGRQIGAGVDVGRAAELAKADLMTAMVGEFPELQGTMGRYYAAAAGEPDELAAALQEHYKPRFAGDSLPATKTGQALALADKLDTLAGIFAIEQRPTGTKDPFALRRAALGVLRILLECHLDVSLVALLEAAAAAQPVQRMGVAAEVYDFIADRLRGLWLERADGTTPEMIDAVFAGRPPSPLDADRRLQALKGFLQLPDAGVLAAINKRIVNLLKKANLDGSVTVNARAFTEPAESELHSAVARLTGSVQAAIVERRYADGLQSLVGLREVVGNFFEGIMVMDENIEKRTNRLALLREVQHLLSGVADLSRLPG